MSTILPDAKILIPVTAHSFSTETIDIKNLFLFPEKKQKLLELCQAGKILPVNITAGEVQFNRSDLRGVLAIMAQIGLRPILTEEAQVSSMRHIANLFEISAGLDGAITLSLNTPEGDVNFSTNIELKNIDEADAVQLVRMVKDATEKFKKPVDVTFIGPKQPEGVAPNEALVPYADPQQVEELRSSLQEAMAEAESFKEYAIVMDNNQKPAGTEIRKTYATALKMTFPDGKMVKLPLTGSEPVVLTAGDVLVGPHPKLLPLHAGTVRYTILEADPSTVTFTVSHQNKELSPHPFRLTRAQFADFSDLYHIRKQSMTAYNLQRKEEIKNAREQKDYDELKVKKSSDKLTFVEKQKLKSMDKEKAHQVMPTVTPVGDNVSKDTGSTPPHALPSHHVSAQALPVIKTSKLSQALGLW